MLGCFYIKCLLDNQCVIWTNNASLGSLFSNQQKGINMADLLGRVHRKQFYLLILMTLFISSCGDDNDNDIEQPVLVTNSAPAISSADTDTASLGTLFTYTLTASDADGDALTFQASLLPAWLAFNATSGELSGTPPAGSAGDYQVTLAASDGVDSTPLFLTISIANSAPVITSTANNNGVVGKAYSYTLTANDANTDTLVYSSVTVPSWATFDVTSRTLSGTPPTTGDFETELSVSDGEAAVNQKFTLVITDQPSVVIGFDETVVFSNFGGAVADIITNPDKAGINTSDKVGRMQKFAGETFGGTTISLDDPITLAAKLFFGQEMSSQFLRGKSIAANNMFTLKVWSQRQVALTFKLEGDVDANDVERVVTHDGTGWEVLNFDFTGVTGTGYTAITLIFDNGVLGDAAEDAANWTFYFDDMVIPVVADTSTDDGNGSGQTATNVNGFENAADSYMFSDFAGGVANVITNPDQSGINTSAQTGQMLKFAGEVFGGSTLTLDGAVDIPVNAIIMMKVWSQRAVDVLFKLEGGPVGEVTAVHGGTGWEELRFDFTGISGVGTTGVTLIFDNGTVGDAANDAANWTFYFDDLTFPVAVDSGTGSGTGGAELTTNGDLEAGDLSGWVAAANDGMITADNTQASGSTWSAHVVAGPLHNPAFSQAGLAVGTVKPGDKIDISFDMCGTAASGGIIFPALLSEFGGDTGADRQTLDTIATPPSVWTRYNYSAVAGSNVNGGISLQLDVVCGADAACKADVYFDNVSVTIGGGPAAGSASGNSCVAGDTGSTSRSNIDFEGMADSYTFSDFGGGVASVITNPDISGINTSAQVGQMMKFAGEVYGGSTLSLDSAIDVADGSIFTLKVWSNRVVAVLFKLEGMNVERIVNHGGMGWEELTFDFTGDTGTGVPAVTLIFDLGVMGDADNTPADWTFYFDDMTLPSVTTDSGTSGSGLSAINFETGGAGAAYTWAVFENSDNPALEIIANPYTSGVNTSATVAKFTARVDGQVYAGVESAHGDFGPLTLDATNSIVKIMVWKSVISDVGIKFAIANGGAKGEIKVPNTQTNQWEEITFDFSGNIGAAESINIDQIIIFPDFNARGAETVSYFDNITFGN